jgi:D-lyxose ketol-isomerase
MIAYPMIREYPSAVCDIPENINKVIEEFDQFCFQQHFNLDKELWWANTIQNEKIKSKMILDLKQKYNLPDDIAEN